MPRSNQLSYPGLLACFVAGAGVEPASGDYEPPEVTGPLPRDFVILNYLGIKVNIINLLTFWVKISILYYKY